MSGRIPIPPNLLPDAQILARKRIGDPGTVRGSATAAAAAQAAAAAAAAVAQYGPNSPEAIAAQAAAAEAEQAAAAARTDQSAANYAEGGVGGAGGSASVTVNARIASGVRTAPTLVSVSSNKLILPARMKREMLLIQNIGGNPGYINFGAAAGDVQGFYLPANGGLLLDVKVPVDAVYGYSALGTTFYAMDA